MAAGYARIRDTIRSYTDGLGSIARIVLGTPGAFVQYPAPTTSSGESKSRATGAAWTGYIVPYILMWIGADIDSIWAPWAHVYTNKTGVPPTINDHTGIASVSKDEVLNTITVTLNPSMVNNRYAIVARPEGAVLIDEVLTINPGDFTLRFNNTAAPPVVQTINDRMVMIQVRGQA